MNKQLLKVGAVAAAMLPVAGFAAIDDQGMQYVSAAEGLHGSLRVDILHSTDDDSDDNAGVKGGDENSLRLWVNGHSDLGGGMSATYYWEIRNGNRDSDGDGNDNAGIVGTEAWDLGLTGSFGEFKFGRLAMTAFRLVPSADLAFERGSERASPGCDPCDNGVRYETPSFSGVKFGVSGIMADNAGEDDAVDEFSFAVSYDSPVGFSVGAGYEVKGLPEGEEVTQGGVATNIADDQAGFRFGTRYSQDNWLVGYEYRTYEGFWDYSNDTVLVIDSNGTSTVRGVGTATDGFEWNPNFEYEVHAFGVQVKIDRITATANFSTETQSGSVTDANGTYNTPDLGQDVFAVDAAYSLGSRSTMVVGWKTTETDSLIVLTRDEASDDNEHAGLTAGTFPVNTSLTERVSSNEVSEVYLFYRVDF